MTAATMKSAATDFESYVAELEEPRRSEFAAVVDLIEKLTPGLPRTMVFGMLGFFPHHYRYVSGREGAAAWIALASQKNYISVYVSGMVGDQSIVESFKPRFPKANLGCGCVRFKRLSDLDSAIFTDLIETSAALHPGG